MIEWHRGRGQLHLPRTLAQPLHCPCWLSAAPRGRLCQAPKKIEGPRHPPKSCIPCGSGGVQEEGQLVGCRSQILRKAGSADWREEQVGKRCCGPCSDQVEPVWPGCRSISLAREGNARRDPGVLPGGGCFTPSLLIPNFALEEGRHPQPGVGAFVSPPSLGLSGYARFSRTPSPPDPAFHRPS